MQRVVTLFPAATETVCALGAGESLVGISHACDHPPEVLDRPRLTHDGPTGPRAPSPFVLDLERLVALQPDVVVTQDLCAVCAISGAGVAPAIAERLPRSVVLRLQPTRWEELFAGIESIAGSLGRHAVGAELVGGIKRRADEVVARVPAGPRPRVLTLEWVDPPMQGGSWTPDLVHLAGGEPLLGIAGEPSRRLTPEELLAAAPEVVLVKPCGLNLEAALAQLRAFRAVVPWRHWPAARSGRVYFADGNAWFNRPGPRLADSLEVLALCLNPERFRDFRRAYGHGVARITTDLLIERW